MFKYVRVTMTDAEDGKTCEISYQFQNVGGAQRRRKVTVPLPVSFAELLTVFDEVKIDVEAAEAQSLPF